MTGQNRSTSVMQRRQAAPDSLDYFPTPPFATRALCEFLCSIGEGLDAQSAWEPACGELHMARPLGEYFASVRASDVHRYADHELIDFTITGATEPMVNWVLTNPPFNLAEAFIATGLKVARSGVAMLLRGAFLEGEERYDRLFARNPPDYVLQFAERVVMLKDRLIQSGAIDPFHNVPGTKASTATSYCWFVWLDPANAGERDTRLRWIPKCRRRLERAGDYPIYEMPAAVDVGGLFGEEA